ncbi:MAG: chemotaxis protein methyltransferase CheR [Sphingomonadales bacterium]|jgi:chemotaxis protein methyltransferase CheR|nr:chemotaxis protein methyltransferase CheR [Sphingomonadales bacterium]MEA3034676.1 chemotaxis protein methyltransferase CheR [Sphingomonadales bacterium]
MVSDGATRILSALLESRTGQQLGAARRWRIETALQPVMRERGVDGLDRLVASIVAGREPALAEAVVEALLNNETFFYRDRPSFDLLLGPALSRLERSRAADKRLAIWCAGCSTGQEAYSIAMRFAEQKLRWAGWTIDILGTDVSRGAIERAGAGLYSQFEVQRGLAVVQMMRWFAERRGAGWQIAPELQAMVRFRVHSLAEPPPQPGRFDIILCRNVLLYFSQAARGEAFARLSSAAAPDAVLMLGAGETVIGQTDAFVSDPACRGLYVPAGVGRERRAAAS